MSAVVTILRLRSRFGHGSSSAAGGLDFTTLVWTTTAGSAVKPQAEIGRHNSAQISANVRIGFLQIDDGL